MEKKWTRRKFLKTGLTGSIVLGSSSVAGRPTANWGDVPEPPDSTSEAFEGPGQEVHCPTLEASTEIKTPRERLSLDGPWSFSYDPRNIGEREEWFHPKAILPEKTVVPGCDQAEDHPSAAMSPEDYEEFHKKNSNPTLYELGVLTELKYPVMAPGWHQKQFGIPPEWQGREIWFHLGGVTPAADFWFNGVKLGSTVSSRCPVRGKVTRLARFGGENTFVVKTYWPKGPRLDGGFDWIGFTGLYRRAWLEAVPRIHVKALHVIGRINPPEATVNFTLAGLAEKQKLLRVSCRIRGINDTRRFSGEIRLEPERAVDGEYSITIPMPGARLWSPQTPNLYQAAVTLFEGDRQIHAAEARFGLREIRCDGLRVLLNGKPIFLRGGCDVHVYPETLAPPASKAFYAERLKKAKKYGFNYTKNCMEIYTREFLDAADEVGYLVCQEMPFGLSGD